MNVWDPSFLVFLVFLYAALSNPFKLSGTEASSFTSLPHETHICLYTQHQRCYLLGSGWATGGHDKMSKPDKLRQFTEHSLDRMHFSKYVSYFILPCYHYSTQYAKHYKKYNWGWWESCMIQYHMILWTTIRYYSISLVCRDTILIWFDSGNVFASEKKHKQKKLPLSASL